MTVAELALPGALSEAHEVGFDYRGGRGVDFEPYPAFLGAAETAAWWRSWTGNPSVDGDEFRVFGQDGTGGMAAFWIVCGGQPVARQPVVFLGSEGELGVVARDLDAYLWVLAAGFGPYEAAMYPDHESTPEVDRQLTVIAQRYAPASSGAVEELIGAARAEFSEFVDTVMAACR